MTMSFIRRIVIALLATSVLSGAALSQAKESPPQDRFAKLDTIRVHYRNYGEGKEAVVFVHGWSCNLNFWKANIPAFVNQSRVIAIDLPGHGESDKPQVTYSMDLFAQAIDAVLHDAKVERATLIGHSMGTPEHVMVGAMDAMMDEAIWKEDKINAPTLAVMAKQPQWNAECQTPATKPSGYGGGLGDVNKPV